MTDVSLDKIVKTGFFSKLKTIVFYSNGRVSVPDPQKSELEQKFKEVVDAAKNFEKYTKQKKWTIYNYYDAREEVHHASQVAFKVYLSLLTLSHKAQGIYDGGEQPELSPGARKYSAEELAKLVEAANNYHHRLCEINNLIKEKYLAKLNAD